MVSKLGPGFEITLVWPHCQVPNQYTFLDSLWKGTSSVSRKKERELPDEQGYTYQQMASCAFMCKAHSEEPTPTIFPPVGWLPTLT